MAPALALVADHVPAESEPLAAQVRRLQHEAHDLAVTHVQCLELALATVSRLAAEIGDGGEAYPVGIRELANRTAADASGRAATLHALLDRSSVRTRR